jgi:uncharacterized repeat protein (TIGR03803 family)
MKKRFPLLMTAIALAVLSGCGPSTNSPIPNSFGAPSLREPTHATYRTIYEFDRVHRNAAWPAGQLLALNGVFYGAASGGRTRIGEGTVFSLTPSGEEHTIYRFKGRRDGAGPNAGLIAVNGTLYGTTTAGGGGCREYSGCGTVFALTTSGQERVIYRFKGGSDGFSPAGSLTWLDGKFYGTTSSGGISNDCVNDPYRGCGTVFSVDTSGNETVLYRFLGNSDGAIPNAPLLAVHGKLYGTTNSGGAGGSCNYSCGTIFSVTTSGVEKVLYEFQGGSDGSSPEGSLIYLDGMLYGTTNGGGIVCCGTVFKSTTSGNESPIYSFKTLPDAQSPRGALTADHGVLYGTAMGGKTCGEYFQSGTIFAVTTAGVERVVHLYPCRPLYYPSPTLLLFDGALYGTTYEGGNKYGNGTAFALTP